MGFLDGVFRRNLDIKESVNFDFDVGLSERAYLKTIALETNINFLARTIAQSEIWLTKNGEQVFNDLSYKLNIRPNTDSSATEFWHKVIYKLIYDNEVLIIKTDKDELVIADDFEREEYALYEDIFKHVQVKDYEYTRNFKMSEVIYLSYNNSKLTSYIDNLFKDYGELFSRVLDSELRNHQLRATLGIKSGGGGLSENNISRLNEHAQRIYNKFKSDTVAIIPQFDGFEFNELSSGTGSSSNSAEKLHTLKKVFIEDVSKLIGIPPNLIHGEVVETTYLMDSYLKFCVNPLIKRIEDELNSKLISKIKYQKGERVKIYGVNRRDPLDHSTSIDKLIASGAFSRNEIRSMFGHEKIDGLDEFVLTKNYTAEGGDNE